MVGGWDVVLFAGCVVAVDAVVALWWRCLGLGEVAGI